MQNEPEDRASLQNRDKEISELQPPAYRKESGIWAWYQRLMSNTPM